MVQGSLDRPPIVIRSSKRISSLLLLIAAVFVAIGVGMLRDPTQNPAIGYLKIFFRGWDSCFWMAPSFVPIC
jgi:hypothetical protein